MSTQGGGRFGKAVSAVTRSLVYLMLGWACAPSAADRAAAEPVTPPAGQVIADFEEGRDLQLNVSGATATFVRDAKDPAAQGERYLRLAAGANARGRGGVSFALPAGVELKPGGALAAQFRAPAGGGETRLRWVALDARRRPLFQRRLTLDAGAGKWRPVELPLDRFRWADDRVGDWPEVESLALVLETPGAEVGLDDLRFAPGRAGDGDLDARTAWLLQLAFEGRPVRQARADGLLVATDAPDRFTDADLARLIDHQRRARAAVRRLFGDAVRPVSPDTPALLLIFANADGQKSFLDRLGREWAAQIAPPAGGGYTVQDIATSTHDAKVGPERPVYLHESVHALLTRDVRLALNDAADHWLHEGVASFIQASVYPKSLDRRLLRAAFARDIDPQGKGPFKPLSVLTARRVSQRDYAQLASVVAFLVAEKPQWLRAIARGLAEGEPLESILKGQGTTLEGLQDVWFAWGRREYATAEPPAPGARPFPPLAEWEDGG